MYIIFKCYCKTPIKTKTYKRPGQMQMQKKKHARNCFYLFSYHLNVE